MNLQPIFNKAGGLGRESGVARHETGLGMRESGIPCQAARRIRGGSEIDRFRKEQAAPGYQVQLIVTQTLKILVGSRIVHTAWGGGLFGQLPDLGFTIHITPRVYQTTSTRAKGKTHVLPYGAKRWRCKRPKDFTSLET